MFYTIADTDFEVFVTDVHFNDKWTGTTRILDEQGDQYLLPRTHGKGLAAEVGDTLVLRAIEGRPGMYRVIERHAFER